MHLCVFQELELLFSIYLIFWTEKGGVSFLCRGSALKCLCRALDGEEGCVREFIALFQVPNSTEGEGKALDLPLGVRGCNEWQHLIKKKKKEQVANCFF